jgi:tetratricopeptide (TPR) repeat protein
LGIIVAAMTNRLTAPLREAPATVPALVATALFIAWATDQAGYPLTHWAPGGLIVLALLAVAVGTIGLHAAEVPPLVKVALGCFAGYTAFSYLSILWAGVPGDAWEGANRTLLYLLVFALFAWWRQRGRSAALLLTIWALAIAGLALYVVLHVRGATSTSLHSLFPGGRLIFPSGYANANAAQWLIAFWPALLLARSEELPSYLRGVLAGGAVLLAEVALLSQSRGSLYATPIMLVLVFALLPGRTRTFALLAPVAIGIGAAAPAVLRVGDKLQREQVVPATVHSAVTAMLVTSVVVALVVTAGATIESRRELSQPMQRRISRAIAAVAIAVLVIALAAGWAAAGNPIARFEHSWNTFKGGYAANSPTNNRLTTGLGSNRYDFYRVALNEFAAHPLGGIGADNFQEQYLLHGRSDETPHYPHSVELRTLTQTGIAGALLALAGLAAALAAALVGGRSAIRGAASDPLARAVAAAALSGFAYFAVHGSFDWFWEFAGLGAPAFALLGLACGLVPSVRAPTRASVGEGDDEPQPPPAAGRRRGGAGRVRLDARRLAVAAGVLVALAAALSLAAPWLSQLQIQSATRVWPNAPRTAYSRLDDAAQLNPLSDSAYVVAGSIALRFGDLKRADHDFSLALQRTPGDGYATLERGAIASAKGERARALKVLERAIALSPREPLAQQALALVRLDERLDVQALNRAILEKAQEYS